ncbi:MAG: hypothetical protein ACHRXM_22175 [Isosphaerales bacterium]
MDHLRRRERDRRFAPCVEGMETRQLPSFIVPFSTSSLWLPPTSFFSYSASNQLAARAAIVRHEYDQYVGVMKTLELKSRAAPGQVLALCDDARAISEAASAANLPPAFARNKAVEVSLQLDRSPLYGSIGDSGWAEVSARLTTNLDSLNVPQPLIDGTLADMKALAASAGVGSDGFQTFTNDFNTLRDGESSLPTNPYYHFADPGLYYTQHLRSFFRGWGAQKVAALAKLQNDLRAVQAESHVEAAGFAVVRRDVRALESLGSAVPSVSTQQLDEVYLKAFTQGVPTPEDLSQLRSSLVKILGPAGSARRLSSVDRLVADAPAFDRAAGASATHLQLIVYDVGAVVDAGGDDTLNPFKVTIAPAPSAKWK